MQVPRVLATDDDVLARMYRIHGPVIYARCRRILGEDAAAEDATQETFMRVQRHLDKLPSVSREALAWIYRIATNYCLNEVRDRRGRPESRETLPDVPSVTARSADDRYADRDLAERLVRRAPEKVRVAAWLHFVDGMDLTEVARVLGISRRTASTRVGAFVENASKFVRRST